MEYWSIRNESLEALTTTYRQEAKVLEDLYLFLQECAQYLNSRRKPFEQVCSIIVMKAHRYALGIYYLILDGIEQEAGALYRPLFEALYMLIYINRNPEIAEKALHKYKMPSYKEIANRVSDRSKEIEGVFHYLSEFASHFVFKPDALQHIVDLQSLGFREIAFHEEEFLYNLRVLTYPLLYLANEAIVSFRVANIPQKPLEKDLKELAQRLDAVFYKWGVPEQERFKLLVQSVISQINSMT